MYLGNSEIKSIVSFLIGYDIANEYDIGIQRQIMNEIFENYKDIEAIKVLKNGSVHMLTLQLDIISNETKKAELLIFKEEA